MEANPGAPNTSLTVHDRRYVEYQDDVDDNYLLLLQRRLQQEHPNQAVFTAVLCPVFQDRRNVQRVTANCKLDTGSEVNVISKKYVETAGMADLIVQIPANEVIEVRGIVENGPGWKPTTKLALLRFYLYNRPTTDASDFFITETSDWDVLLSQKYYSTLGEQSRPDNLKKLLWLRKLHRTPSKIPEAIIILVCIDSPTGQERIQQEFAKRREIERKAAQGAYDERENQKKAQQYEVRQLPSPRPLGRAWTMNDDHTMALLPRPSLSTAAQNSIPINQGGTSLEQQVTQPPEDISNGGPNSKRPI
jgi:hypothetical protein